MLGSLSVPERAGVRFHPCLEVSFEGRGFAVVREGDGNDGLPGQELRGMGRLARVMGFEPFMEAGGQADVTLAGVTKTAQKVDVLHSRCPPSPSFRRAMEGTNLRVRYWLANRSAPFSKIGSSARRLVEAGGVEPPSEKATTETSPGAARALCLAAVAPSGRVYLGHLDCLRLGLRELD